MNNVNIDDLLEIMRGKLQTFNNEKVTISDLTVHSDVLSNNDGFRGHGSSAPLYIESLMWSIWASGGNRVKFPNDWLGFTVKELADFIISKQKYT